MRAYIESRLCGIPRGVGVALAKRNKLLRHALCFFGLGPCGRNGFVLEEGGDEVTEKGLPVRGFAAEMAVFHVATGHGGGTGKEVRLGEDVLEIREFPKRKLEVCDFKM